MADEKAVNVTKSTTASNNPNNFTMKIIFGLIGLMIMIMIMATVLIINFSGKGRTTIIRERVVGSDDSQKSPGSSGPAEEFGLLVPLNELIVNLASEPGAEHYLKVNITLEVVNNEKVKEEVVKRVPQLRDLVISILRTKTKDNIDEKEGKEKLSIEINNKLNGVLGGPKVRHVFFEDFMIQ